jgi:hypothetical protein
LALAEAQSPAVAAMVMRILPDFIVFRFRSVADSFTRFGLDHHPFLRFGATV